MKITEISNTLLLLPNVIIMFAERVNNIAPSGTVKLANRVKEMKAKGMDVISFVAGEPDFDTPGHITEAGIKAMRDGFTHYTPSNGILELREAIAEKSAGENGIRCDWKNVIVTPAKLAVFMSCLALVEKGDEVLMPNPCWVSYVPCVNFAGGTPVFVETSQEDCFRLSPEKLAEKVTDKTKMIILNSPSNPTGAVYSKDDLKAIADIAKDKDIFVMSDEIYEKIIYEGEHFSIGSIDGMMERCLTINGFSKAYAMTGWRIGWLVASEDVIDAVGRIQQHSLTCVNSFAQKGALAALKARSVDAEGVDDIERMVREFRKRRDIMVAGLNSIERFSCPTPQGAFYAFPGFSLDKTSNDVAEFLLENARVAVTPGSAFGKCGEGYLRFSYATSQEKIMEGLERIRESVAGLK